MEDRDGDALAWYCGAPGPDKTGLSRGDFEALQNEAGISWAEASKASTYINGEDDPDEYNGIRDKMDVLPKKGHQFMPFAPGTMSLGATGTYRITLFALNRNLQDWSGDWGNGLLSSPSIRDIVTESINGSVMVLRV